MVIDTKDYSVKVEGPRGPKVSIARCDLPKLPNSVDSVDTAQKNSRWSEPIKERRWTSWTEDRQITALIII